MNNGAKSTLDETNALIVTDKKSQQSSVISLSFARFCKITFTCGQTSSNRGERATADSGKSLTALAHPENKDKALHISSLVSPSSETDYCLRTWQGINMA